MRNYECTIIVSPTVGEDGYRSAAKKYANVIASGNGELTQMENWGKLRLAYEINHHDEGYYLFYRLRCENAVLSELNRLLRLDENVLRHLIIRDANATGNEPKIDPETIIAGEKIGKEEI